MEEILEEKSRSSEVGLLEKEEKLLAFRQVVLRVSMANYRLKGNFHDGHRTRYIFFKIFFCILCMLGGGIDVPPKQNYIYIYIYMGCLFRL